MIQSVKWSNYFLPPYECVYFRIRPPHAAGLKANKEKYCLLLKIVFCAVTSDFSAQTIISLSRSENGAERGKEKWEGCCWHSSIKEEGLPVSREWGFFFFLTGIDIARIFNSFFFERQQCVVWKLGHNLGFVRDPFLLVRAQLPIWDTTCAATITMAPSDRQDKKPKDASPLTLNSTEKLCQPLYLHCLHVQSRCSLTCTPLTPTKTPGPGLLTRCCVVYCIMQWWSDTVPRQGSKTRGQERRTQVATRLCRDLKMWFHL